MDSDFMNWKRLQLLISLKARKRLLSRHSVRRMLSTFFRSRIQRTVVGSNQLPFALLIAVLLALAIMVIIAGSVLVYCLMQNRLRLMLAINCGIGNRFLNLIFPPLAAIQIRRVNGMI